MPRKATSLTQPLIEIVKEEYQIDEHENQPQETQDPLQSHKDDLLEIRENKSSEAQDNIIEDESREERKKRLRREAQARYRNRQMEKLSPLELDAIRQTKTDQQRLRRQKESEEFSEQQANRLKIKAQKKRERISLETPEQRHIRLQKDKEAKRLKRQNETSEQKEWRMKQNREATRRNYIGTKNGSKGEKCRINALKIRMKRNMIVQYV